MTIKKTIISSAAAALLVAGMTGCSSSDNNYAGGGTTAPSATVTGVDGYILNATATAYYVDDKNSTVPVEMKTTLASINAVDPTKNVKGTPQYTISNETNLSKVRFYSIENKTRKTEGSTVTYETFIDDGSVAGQFDANDTVFVPGGSANTSRFVAGTKLYAPATGFKVITPITTLVFETAGGTAAFAANAANGADFNKTKVEDALAKVAAIINVSAEQMRTVDPLNTTDVKYQQLNTFLSSEIKAAGFGAFATNLLKEANATATTSYLDTMKKLAKAAGNAGVFQAAVKEIETVGEDAYVKALATSNLDKSVNNGGGLVASKASTTAIANVTAIKLGSTHTTDLVLNGDKANPTDFSNLNLQLAAVKDANTTGKVDLIVQMQGGKSYNAGSAASDEITVKISGLTLDTVDGALTIKDNNESEVRYSVAYQDQNKTDVTYSEFADANATAAFGSAKTYITNNTGLVTIDLATLITDVDSNISTTTGKTLTADTDMTAKLSNIKVVLVDNNLLSKVTTSTPAKTLLWGTTTIASVAKPTNSNVAGSGKTLINLSAADMRGDATDANAKPNYDANVTDDSNLTVFNGTENVTDVNGSKVVLMLNQTAVTTADKNITLGFGKNDTNSKEVLNTFKLSSASGIVTKIGTLTDGAGKTDVNGTAAAKVELTIDTNSTDKTFASGKHPEYVFTYKPTDEFNKAGDERNVTIQLNRAPDINVSTGGYLGNGSGIQVDTNLTATTGDIDKNVTLTGLVHDIDGMTDFNSTNGMLCFVAINAIGGSNSGADRVTSSYTTIAPGSCLPAIHFGGVNPADANITLTTGYVASTGNVELRIVAAGDFNTSVAGGSASQYTDYNLTVIPVDKYNNFSTSNAKNVLLRLNLVADTASSDVNTTGQ